MCLVNEINDLGPVYNKWYMDDGGIVGDVELLSKAWEILKSRGPALGLPSTLRSVSGVGWMLIVTYLVPSDLTE